MTRRPFRLVLAALVLVAPASGPAGAQAPTAARDPVPTRVRWTTANTVVYADSGEGVHVWFGTNHRAMQGGEPAIPDADDGFAADSVEQWTVMTRQLLALTAPPVPGDTQPLVSSGVLHGRRGTMLVAGRVLEGGHLRDSIRFFVLQKGNRALVFDLAPRDLDALVAALETGAAQARAAGFAPAAPDSTIVEANAVPGEPASYPRYPAELKKANVEGEVWMTFDVDTTGRADPSTVRALLSDAPGFEQAVRTSLLRAHYRPATVGGRPVRSRTHQRWTFALTR